MHIQQFMHALEVQDIFDMVKLELGMPIFQLECESTNS